MTTLATATRRKRSHNIKGRTISNWLIRFTIFGITIVTFRQIYLDISNSGFVVDHHVGNVLIATTTTTETVPLPTQRRRIDATANNEYAKATSAAASAPATTTSTTSSSNYYTSYSALTYPTSHQSPPPPPPPPLPYVYENHNYRSRHYSVFVADSARERRGGIEDLSSIGDPKHLGGFDDTRVSNPTFSPTVLKHLVEKWGVRSVVDVGCGRGWVPLWFLTHGLSNVQGIDGSPAASKKSVFQQSSSAWHNYVMEKEQNETETSSNDDDDSLLLLNNNSKNNNTSSDINNHNYHIEHDYTNGPWWTDDTIDLVWSTNFVQQVSLQHMPNYLATFSKAAIIVITVPQDAGWHHVEIHNYKWWIQRLQQLNGYLYDDDLTQKLKQVALEEFVRLRIQSPDGHGHYYCAKSLWTDLLVFTNPRVIGLPRHNLHLFPQFGCFRGKEGGGVAGIDSGVGEELLLRECGTMAGKLLESKLDPSLYPIKLNKEMDTLFDELVRKQMILDKNSSSSNEYNQPLLVDVLPPGPPVSFKDHPIHKVKQQALSQTYTWISPSLRKPGITTSKNANNSTSSLPPQHRIPVVAWPYIIDGADTTNAEAKHIHEDGVQESPYLYLSHDIYDFHPSVVWVGDTSDAGDREWDAFCINFLEIINKARKKRSENGLPLSWPLFIVDWTDYPMPMRCRIIESVVGQEFVKYSHRSIVEDRSWNYTADWVGVGSYLRTEKLGGGQNITYKHTPLTVRTDTVKALDQILKARGLDLTYPIATIPRDIDVTHLWPRDGKFGVGIVESKLRTKVSSIVSEMAEQASSNSNANATTTTALATTAPLKVHVGLAGLAVRDGRRSVMNAYVERLLQSKIVIVTQRDSWEDHYRLFEALVAGPLVLMDKMLSLPAELEHGVSVVEFTSEQDMRNKIMYYIEHPRERMAIASEGRRIAMSRHRSWHRMEEIIFDTPLSRCLPSLSSQEEILKDNKNRCPYTLHATLS